MAVACQKGFWQSDPDSNVAVSRLLVRLSCFGESHPWGTGGFDSGRFTAAPLQMQGVIWFPGSTDPAFARITDRRAMTDWVPLLETVQVSHPKLLWKFWRSPVADDGRRDGRLRP